MVRVLHIFISMNRGGAESMVMNYYRHIDRSKVQFDFLVHREQKGEFDDEIRSLGGIIHKVAPINIFNPKKYYSELSLFFKEHATYQIIHSHINTFSYYPLKIAQEFNIPVRIAHAHTALPKPSLKDFLNVKEIKETIKTLIKFQLKKKIHQNSNYCFACGRRAGSWLFGVNSNFTIINNAIDSSKFVYDKVIAEQYKSDHNLLNKIVIGHVGNFTEPKNHTFILDIFYELQKMDKKFHLVLIGDGPLRNNIEAKIDKLKIKERVSLLGVRKDIHNLCKMIDVFVFPSLYEGLPVTLIEAQASGLQVFVSNSVTSEVNITNKIIFMPINLEKAAKNWAQSIKDSIPYKRKDTSRCIINSGYDIKTSALLLEKFYLNSIMTVK